jgi:uncharacterized protein with ATP-grasp and redox domains
MNCIPCIEKQLRNELPFVPNEEKDISKRSFAELLDRTIGRRAPVQISLELHEILMVHGGSADPYGELKDISNRNALALLPVVQGYLHRSMDRLRTVAIASTAGNVIDYGAKNLFDLESMLRDAVDHGMALDMIECFGSDISQSSVINIIADNSGECVMDNVLMNELLGTYPDLRIDYWVKRSPILNDITRSDALNAGIEEGPRLRIVEIARDGWISDDEIDSMEGVVLSKGQGNYEILSDRKGIYFALAVKCEVVASDIGVRVGDLVFFKK